MRRTLDQFSAETSVLGFGDRSRLFQLVQFGKLVCDTKANGASQFVSCLLSLPSCDFWSIHRGALWRLHAASATDPELGESLRARNQRRRHLLSVLVGRMIEGGVKRPELADELIDVLFALTSVAFFWELTAAGQKTNAACRLIRALAADAVQRALSG